MNFDCRRGLYWARWLGVQVLLLCELLVGMPAPAEAQWTITTYLRPVGNPPITNIKLADQYFTGAKPQRFTGESIVTMLDFAHRTPSGSFLIDNPFPGIDSSVPPNRAANIVVRVDGVLQVMTPGQYDFANRFRQSRIRLDLDQDGTFQETESILDIPRVGERFTSRIVTLATGNFPFEWTYFSGNGGPGALEAVYRIDGTGTQFLIGDATGGIGLVGPAEVRTVGAAVTDRGGDLVISNFALADALRTGPNEPGFPVSESREVFEVVDLRRSNVPRVQGKQGVPGLGVPNFDDDDNFLVVGQGMLVVPPGGISRAIFRSTADDGARLLIDTNQDGDLLDPGDVILLDDTTHPPRDILSKAISLREGNYQIEYSFFELGDNAEAAIMVDLGRGFHLLGDNAAVAAGNSLEVIPEPATVTLAGLAILAMAGRMAIRRRFRRSGH